MTRTSPRTGPGTAPETAAARPGTARPGSRRTGTARLVGALGAALLLAGCAAMPSTGAPAAPAGSGGNTQTAQQVVVVAEPPKAGDPPLQTVSGFLDDLVSDEQNYQTAKQFLTPAAAASWQPQEQVAVLDHVDVSVDTDDNASTATRATIKVKGKLLATLNSRHAYVPVPSRASAFVEKVVVTKGPEGWRITNPPKGIVLNQVDFARIYEPVNLYFPVARAGGDDSAAASALAADPIYVRSHIDPLTDAASALLGGPSDWLAPAVVSAFPPDSSLGRARVSVGSAVGDGNVRFEFGGAIGAKLRQPEECQRMASQLYFTLSEVPTQQAQQVGQPISSVSLYKSGDPTVSCEADEHTNYSPFQAPNGAISYFVDAQGHLESLDMGVAAPTPKPVTGVLGPSNLGHIGGFAVAPGNSDQVAVLSETRRELFISSLTQRTVPPRATVTSGVNGGLSSPSWDDLKTLWVADTNPAAPAVKAVVDGKLVPVAVNGLQGVVTGVRVAADGARIALIVKNGGNSSVQVGRIEQSGTADAPQLTIDGLLSVAPSLSSVKSVSWYDGDSLIVLGQSVGTEPGLDTAPGLSIWEVDGSSALAPAEQLTSPPYGTTVAALQQDSSLQLGVRAPLLGDSSGAGAAKEDQGKVYRFAKNQWSAVVKNGDSGPHGPNGPMPSYPG
ncbi:LpqB family beta-propeller domain-containing protein [Streptacidiphilus sp. N1-12]|uniref:LpqB family beta-propeller domain-containing protein n=2 Tax=Streptacidiphilus alkalitolerans TaxID=3342712 RepID=A0ABV6VHV3_9ACTN